MEICLLFVSIYFEKIWYRNLSIYGMIRLTWNMLYLRWHNVLQRRRKNVPFDGAYQWIFLEEFDDDWRNVFPETLRQKINKISTHKLRDGTYEDHILHFSNRQKRIELQLLNLHWRINFEIMQNNDKKKRIILQWNLLRINSNG